MVGEKLAYIGIGGSKRLGHLEFGADSLKAATLDDEEIRIPMRLNNRNDYLYADYVENEINGFRIVCHIVKANGDNRDVLLTLFLRHFGEFQTIQSYLETMKAAMEIKTENPPIRAAVSKGIGWLTRRKG